MPDTLTRRDALITVGLLAAGVASAGSLLALPAERGTAAPGPAPVQVMPDLFIRPRDSWGADLAPKRAITPETVQFLLVHHTASPNRYPAGGARDVIRATYSYHTSSAKGWPDVCYQFFVDHDGVVWEGRAGALAGPVQADATGGSQGFAQLVCLIGDFTETPASDAMAASLVKVLAWLAERYGIDTSPGAQTSFVSRGSQRYRAGTSVTAATISAHRDMSYTACPGNVVYATMGALREQVAAQREAWRGAMFRADRMGPASP